MTGASKISLLPFKAISLPLRASLGYCRMAVIPRHITTQLIFPLVQWPFLDHTAAGVSDRILNNKGLGVDFFYF